MFETIKRNLLAGRIDEVGVQNALKKGWLTAAQAAEILGIENEAQALERLTVEERD